MKTKHISFLLAILLITACSASKQAFKEAREYEEMGFFVDAAESDLKALNKDPKFKEAKAHLRKVAPYAYNELLTRAQNVESLQQNWDQAVKEYSYLNHLLDSFNRHGVVFETVNIKARLKKAKQNAAAYHYNNAENFFAQKNWDKAGIAYLKAHEYIDNYNMSFDKAIESYLNSGKESLKNKEYESALSAFARVLDIAPGHPGAKILTAQTHFQFGRHLFDSGSFREAYYRFDQAMSYNPDYPGIEEWIEKAYQNAVQYVAIFPFLNNTDVHIDGYRIASDLTTYATHANLEFANFLPHPETITLLSGTGMTRYGRVTESELVRVAIDEELDSFVWGVIREIDVRDHPQKMNEYSHDNKVTVKDTSGKDVEKTETIYYREYNKEREVVVNLECLIIETETGKTLFNDRYRERATDVARWIAYQGSIYDLPKNKRGYLDASRDPKPVGEMIDELLAKVVREIGTDVVRFYK